MPRKILPKCPKCSGTDIHLGEYVYRRWTDLRIKDGTLIAATSSDDVVWEASKDQALYCNTCEHEWESDLPLDWE